MSRNVGNHSKMRTVLAVAVALAAGVLGGQLHQQPCYIRAEEQREHVISPRPHEYLKPEALPTAYDTRQVLQSLGASTPVSRNQQYVARPCSGRG
jgi:hypothetical protein